MSIKLFTVIQSLCPEAQFGVTADQKLIWNDQNIKEPSEDAINAERKRLEAQLIATAYIKQRVRAYPSVGDQLDMLWHAMDSKEIPMCKEFYVAIKGVKDKYPKP